MCQSVGVIVLKDVREECVIEMLSTYRIVSWEVWCVIFMECAVSDKKVTIKRSLGLTNERT